MPTASGGRINIHSHTRVGTGISLYRPGDGPLSSTDNWDNWDSLRWGGGGGGKDRRRHPRGANSSVFRSTQCSTPSILCGTLVPIDEVGGSTPATCTPLMA